MVFAGVDGVDTRLCTPVFFRATWRFAVDGLKPSRTCVPTASRWVEWSRDKWGTSRAGDGAGCDKWLQHRRKHAHCRQHGCAPDNAVKSVQGGFSKGSTLFESRQALRFVRIAVEFDGHCQHKLDSAHHIRRPAVFARVTHASPRSPTCRRSSEITT
jgi:hypothetical protein